MPPVRPQWTKLPLVFDPEGLRADLLTIPANAWVPHFNQQAYAGQWSSVALRSRSGRSGDTVAQGTVEEFHNTPLAQQCTHLQAAVDAFEFQKKSVRLQRLHPGSRVRDHRIADLGLADGELRIHVPITANEDVEIVVANRRLMLREGEAWFIDILQPHRMDNRGRSDCIYLVIDGILNDWANALLERSAQEIASETFEPVGAVSFRNFREMVFEDAQLQAKLLGIADRRRFLEAVVAAGAACGCEFDLAVAESAFNQRLHEWMKRPVVA